MIIFIVLKLDNNIAQYKMAEEVVGPLPVEFLQSDEEPSKKKRKSAFISIA